MPANQCPRPIELNYLGQRMSFDWAPVCKFMNAMGYVVSILAAAYLFKCIGGLK